MPLSGSKHYGIKAFRKSFIHFVLGKGFAAGSTFVVLLLIIRALSIAEFAVYTSLHALTRIMGLVSSFGVNSVLHRFVPELRTHSNNKPMYQLLMYSIALRAVLYLVLIAVLLPFIEVIANAFKLQDWLWIVPWYFAVGFFRANATFVVMALENLLWQKEAQYSAAIGGLIKLVLVVFAMSIDQLSLANFVIIEGISEAATLVILLCWLIVRRRNDHEKHLGDSSVLMTNRNRYLRFGAWSYMQNLTSISYGSPANRLFVSYFMPTELIALFGVIDRLIEYIRKFAPIRLFVGLIRPKFMSRYSIDNDFSHIVSMGNFLFRLNLLVLVPLFILFSVAGETLFNWISSGKYTNASLLFLGFYTVIVISSINVVLDLLVKAVEHTRIFTISNLTLSASIFLAIPLIPHLGLWSIAIANIAGLVLSVIIITVYMRRYDYIFTFDWRLSFLILAITILSIAAGFALKALGLIEIIAAIAACTLFLAIILVKLPLKHDEKVLIQQILPSKLKFLIRMN